MLLQLCWGWLLQALSCGSNSSGTTHERCREIIFLHCVWRLQRATPLQRYSPGNIPTSRKTGRKPYWKYNLGSSRRGRALSRFARPFHQVLLFFCSFLCLSCSCAPWQVTPRCLCSRSWAMTETQQIPPVLQRLLPVPETAFSKHASGISISVSESLSVPQSLNHEPCCTGCCSSHRTQGRRCAAGAGHRDAIHRDVIHQCRPVCGLAESVAPGAVVALALAL